VATVDLVHDEAQRVVLPPKLERVFGSGDGQVIAPRVIILEKQSAVSGESHGRHIVSVVELSHPLPRWDEHQVCAVEIRPVRLVVRIRLRRLAAVKSKCKFIQLCRAENARVPYGYDGLVGAFADGGRQTGNWIDDIVFGAVYVVGDCKRSFSLTGELVVNLDRPEIFIGEIASGTGNAGKSIQKTAGRIPQLLQEDGSSLSRQGKKV